MERIGKKFRGVTEMITEQHNSELSEKDKEIEMLRKENAEIRQAFHDIYEVWAGSEIGQPEYASEAYLIQLIEEMLDIAGKWKCHSEYNS